METIGSTCHPYLAINGRKWEGLVPSKSQPWSSKLNETWQVQNGGSNNIKTGQTENSVTSAAVHRSGSS